jgi:hypothetical protein
MRKLPIVLVCAAIAVAGVAAQAPMLVLEPRTPDRKLEIKDPLTAIASFAVPDELLTEIVREIYGTVLLGPLPMLDPTNANGALQADDAFQDEEMATPESILDEIPRTLVIAGAARDLGHERGGVWALLTSPFAVVSAASQEPAPLRMLVTSLGVPTGDAFSVQFLNQGSAPITLPPGSLTLRPLKKEAGERAVREFSRLRGRLTTTTMFGYCLNFSKLPPRRGMVYAIAPQALQQQSRSARDVLLAASALYNRRLIKPDGDPRSYFHSLRQWAVWSREQRFTPQSFTSALLDNAKKNLAAAKQPWTPQAEAYVRGTAPKRWTDVTNVLRLADKLTGGGQ